MAVTDWLGGGRADTVLLWASSNNATNYNTTHDNASDNNTADIAPANDPGEGTAQVWWLNYHRLEH